MQLGADVIVAQGGEGGGHTGTVPTSLLLPQVLDAVKVPVAAAGGFHDGRGLAAALAWGADGIAMGTRFLLTKESPVPLATLERYFKAGVTDIYVTTKVDGMPQRVIRNELVNTLEAKTPVGLLMTAVKSGLAYRKLTGASIGELSAVRKYLSRLKGGGLARAAAPARVVALALSDVVGDDLSTIGSGPTVPDPTTFAEALAVLERRELLGDVPERVRQRITDGARGRLAETPKPGDPIFRRVATRVVGSGRLSVLAAAREA